MPQKYSALPQSIMAGLNEIINVNNFGRKELSKEISIRITIIIIY